MLQKMTGELVSLSGIQPGVLFEHRPVTPRNSLWFEKFLREAVWGPRTSGADGK
jgi:hypothetical protein